MGSLTSLARTDGPACPKCGCTETAAYEGRRRWTRGNAARRYRCAHCGRVFYCGPRWPGEDLPDEPVEVAGGNGRPGGAVIYRPVRCPECNSTRTKITSTRRPIRHHKCSDCGAAFKSVEQGGPGG